MLNRLTNHFTWFLVLAFLIAFAINFESTERFYQQLKPILNYQFSLSIDYQSDEEVSITTYIPESNDRQTILEEQIIKNGHEVIVTDGAKGRTVNWSGLSPSQQVAYRFSIVSQSLQFQISPEISIPSQYPDELMPYLGSSDAIQVNHPEIKALWKLIKPVDDSNMYDVLRAIFNYTYQDIKGAPFKGVTDALTALRLKTASCNGKSRLFIALARYNNLPARLIGGVILNGVDKKTSHQWLEVFIENQWVPFGPTNGHFATLPQNFLELYRGDESLFRHSRDINFNYLFSSSEKLVAPAVYLHQQSNNPSVNEPNRRSVDITGILLSMGLKPITIGLFLLFPICTLLITILRNVIGVKTFGIFLPMLIAAACIFMGLLKGIVGFVIILVISFIAHHFLKKMQLLKVPRLAAIITINTMVFVVGLMILGAGSRLEFGMLSLFPVIIISFVAERIHSISEDGDWVELSKRASGTIASIIGCYWLLNSFVLQGVFSFYPETFLLVLAGQIYLGKWTGIKLSELIRFKEILSNQAFPVVGINSRNRDFVYQRNTKELLDLAADKLASKAALSKVAIPIPETLFSIESLTQINQLPEVIFSDKGFALKPNKGSQGNGILIVKGFQNGEFIGAGNKSYSVLAIKQHCSEIISGCFSQSGDQDVAYFEPLIEQHQSLQVLAPYGLSDIRVILSNGKIVSAMLRMPTKHSNGKANLHQGAIGIGIDIETGRTISAKHNKKNMTKHPDSGEKLIGIEIDFWSEIKAISESCFKAIPLGYIGVDICIDRTRGPLVLEVNGRPGIEIQNIQERGFYNELSKS
ncbi:MAG: sugar-transfer associated ATP-grasp domain-containing protein [Kangiellaceae bacterium]